MKRLGLVLVFLMPFAASLGPMVRVGPLVTSRLVSVLVIGLSLLALRRHRWIPPVALWTLLLALVWGGYGIARLQPGRGLREVLSVMIGLLTGVALVILASAARGGRSRTLDEEGPAEWLRVMCRGWLLGWFATCVPAMWEIATGRHLWNYREDAAQWIRDTAVDIASYMVNPNLFAFFLACAMGMLMLGWHLEKGRLRWVFAVCVLATPMICWFTNARLVVAVMPLYLVAFAAQQSWFRRAAAFGAAAGLSFLVLALPIVARMPYGVPSRNAGSNYQRLALYRSGWSMLWQTFGSGVGPGEFETWVTTARAPYATYGGPPNPHSGVFETVSQYGLVVGALAMAGLAALVFLGGTALLRRWPDRRIDGLRWILFVSALTLVPLSFANSTWLESSVAFIHLAGLLLVADVILADGSSPVPTWVPRPIPQRLPQQARLLRRAVGAKR